MKTEAVEKTFALWLRRQMEEQDLSQRALARKWMPEDENKARTYIRRYLRGVVPIERSRRDLAATLNVEDPGAVSSQSSEDD